MKKLYVPIITPFREDETVNYDALKKLVRTVLDDGADGIYAGGSSAECFLMTEEERMKTLETVIEAADGAPVIAHIGAIGSQLTERLARHAERAGAAMVSSVPPFYYSFGFEQIKQYYWDLTDAVNLPMVVYYIPTRMGYSFTAGQLAEIMNGRDNIKSVKFTSTDYYMLQQVAALTGKKMISGKDECFISAMAMHADGAIGTSFNCYIGHYKAILGCLERGDWEGGYRIQCKANAIMAKMTEVNLFHATKVLLEHRGIEAGVARRPNRLLSEEQKRSLIRCYEENQI